MCSRIGGYFEIEMRQHGLLRSLGAAELSDGTLRYLLLVAALLSPRPPPLMILNEPETSLHPDLLPALARLIAEASRQSQIIVVSHAAPLVSALQDAGADGSCSKSSWARRSCPARNGRCGTGRRARGAEGRRVDDTARRRPQTRPGTSSSAMKASPVNGDVSVRASAAEKPKRG